MSGNAKLMRAISILVSHALKHKRITGDLPDHEYLILAFEIEYEFADYVLMVARVVSPAKKVQDAN